MAEYRKITNLEGKEGQQGPAGIGSHGILSQTTDITGYRDEEHIGHYVIRADNLIGGPDLEGNNPLVHLEVYRGAGNGVMHRASTSRQSFYRIASSATGWADWIPLTAGPRQEGGVIISDDRYAEIPEGSVLYVVDPGQRAYDFHAFPEGTSTLISGGTWRKNSVTGLLGARGISQDGFGHSAIKWNDADGFSDGDILARCQRNRLGTSARNALIARASDAGGMTGYGVYLVIVSGQVRLAVCRWDQNSDTLLQSEAVNIGEGDVFYTRFNLQGSMLRAKAWLSGDQEPLGWLLAVQDSAHSSGAVGFSGAIASTAWDVLSVNESGGLAA